MPKIKKKNQQQPIVVRKKYNTSGSNKIFGIISQQNLNTALAVGAFIMAAGIGYKVFFSNGKGEGQDRSQQENSQNMQQSMQNQGYPLQQTPFPVQNNNISPEDVKAMIKRGGPIKVQPGSIAADIAQNVAALSTHNPQEVFSEQPPIINQHPEPEKIVQQAQPKVQTKEQIMSNQFAKKPHVIPPYGDNYYNAVSHFPSGFFLKNPAPAEKNK